MALAVSIGKRKNIPRTRGITRRSARQGTIPISELVKSTYCMRHHIPDFPSQTPPNRRKPRRNHYNRRRLYRRIGR